MTDKEIIKALECLCGNETLCPRRAYDPCEFPRGKENVAQDVLRLVAYQKTRIEELYVALDERIQRIETLVKEMTEDES